MMVNNASETKVDYIDPITKKRMPLASYTTGNDPLYFSKMCYNSFSHNTFLAGTLLDRATAAAFVAVYLGCSNPSTTFSGVGGYFVKDVLDLAIRAQAYHGSTADHHVFRMFPHPQSLVTQAYLNRWNLEIIDGTVVIW